MKILVIAAALFSLSALASDKQKDGQMWGTLGEVPDPVPIGYPYCIRIDYKAEHWDSEAKADIFFAPISFQDTKWFAYVRLKNMGRLVHCDEKST